MSDTMQGVRRNNPDSLLPKNGEYGKDANGDWFGMTPTGDLANLSAHEVVEHEYGTITVSPSILVSRPPHEGEPGFTQTNDVLRHPVRGVELWHGYLERGTWRPV